MNQTRRESSAALRAADSLAKETKRFVRGFWGVRYQVKDVSRSIAFYTQQLGFKLDHQNLPAFGQVSIGDLSSYSAAPGPRVPVQCPTVITRSPADGTV